MHEQIQVFECEDRYEVDKIISLFSLQKDNSYFILNIARIISNEVIIKLKDNSCHSIVMKNQENAIKFNDFFREILKGEKIVKHIKRDDVNKENINFIYV